MRRHLAGLALATLAATACGSNDAAPADTSAAAVALDDPRVSRADAARIMGSPDASVWVLIVSDFQCPYCKQFQDLRAEQVKREFVEPGTVRFAYINYPLRQHANAMPAAEAAMCAGAQDRFWPYHDRVFDTVDEWGTMPNPLQHFEKIAAELSLDVAAFRQCMQDDVMLPMIRADYQRGVEAGVRSTPTFIVGQSLIEGVAPIETFRAAITQAVAAAGK